MKFKIDEEMKRKIFVYSASLGIAIIIWMLLYNLDILLHFLAVFLIAATPFLFGLLFAFILNKPVELLEHTIFRKFPKRKLFAVLFAFLLFIGLIFLMFATVIPSLIASVETFSNNLTIYQKALVSFISSISSKFNIDLEELEDMISSTSVMNTISSFLKESLPKLMQYSYSFLKSIVNVLLAFVAAAYMLLDKKNLCNTFKSLNYALFTEDMAGRIDNFMHDAQNIFEQYIVGSVIDSFIVGVFTYFACLIFRLPYSPMVAFVVGLTNVIPVFGPFLGAVPVIIIYLLIKPMYAILFAILILFIQQCDGNIIKPLVLGDRLGISGFWILFSVTIGGSVHGIIGMFLGVPIFALFYSLLSNFTTIQLENKSINLNKVRYKQKLKWAEKLKEKIEKEAHKYDDDEDFEEELNE